VENNKNASFNVGNTALVFCPGLAILINTLNKRGDFR